MDCVDRILLDEKALNEIVKRLGKKISEDYKDKNLLMISVLKGSVIFMSDLMRSITIECKIDFMSVSSYGGGVKSSGVVKILKDLDIPMQGHDLLVVEDILDSGQTLSYILELLKARKPRSVRICTLLDKPSARKSDVKAYYVGAEIPNDFVVGYGLDYEEKYRNLPFVGILKPSVYNS